MQHLWLSRAPIRWPMSRLAARASCGTMATALRASASPRPGAPAAGAGRTRRPRGRAPSLVALRAALATTPGPVPSGGQARAAPQDHAWLWGGAGGGSGPSRLARCCAGLGAAGAARPWHPLALPPRAQARALRGLLHPPHEPPATGLATFYQRRPPPSRKTATGPRWHGWEGRVQGFESRTFFLFYSTSRGPWLLGCWGTCPSATCAVAPSWLCLQGTGCRDAGKGGFVCLRSLLSPLVLSPPRSPHFLRLPLPWQMQMARKRRHLQPVSWGWGRTGSCSYRKVQHSLQLKGEGIHRGNAILRSSNLRNWLWQVLNPEEYVPWRRPHWTCAEVPGDPLRWRGGGEGQPSGDTRKPAPSGTLSRCQALWGAPYKISPSQTQGAVWLFCFNAWAIQSFQR